MEEMRVSSRLFFYRNKCTKLCNHLKIKHLESLFEYEELRSYIRK